MIRKSDFCTPQGIDLVLHPTIIFDGPRGKEGHQDDRAQSPSDLVVHRSEFLITWTKPTENGTVGGFPERLGVGKEGINARHQRRTPQINGRPSVRQELRWGGKGECRRMEEVGQVEDEEAGVGGKLKRLRLRKAKVLFGSTQQTYQRSH